MLAYLVAISLLFHLPSRVHIVSGCGSGLDTLFYLQSYKVTYQRQSQTWVDHHYAMQANRDTFAYYWPMVKMEAEPIILQSGDCRGRQGQPMTVPLPLYLNGYFWKVTTTNLVGESCPTYIYW